MDGVYVSMMSLNDATVHLTVMISIMEPTHIGPTTVPATHTRSGRTTACVITYALLSRVTWCNCVKYWINLWGILIHYGTTAVFYSLKSSPKLAVTTTCSATWQNVSSRLEVIRITLGVNFQTLSSEPLGVSPFPHVLAYILRYTGLTWSMTVQEENVSQPFQSHSRKSSKMK